MLRENTCDVTVYWINLINLQSVMLITEQNTKRLNNFCNLNCKHLIKSINLYLMFFFNNENDPVLFYI